MKTTFIYKNIDSVLILAAFLLLSGLYFDKNNFDSFNQYLIGNNESDKYFYVWSLAWWPHAIIHGLNPFITKMAWAPIGFNLTKSTPIPGLALLTAPLTLSVGPIAAYNAIAILTPGLAAWSMFILCRYITRTIIPAIFAGYLFGFSSYEISHMAGHLNLTAGIFLLPLLIYFAIRFLNQEQKLRRFIIVSTLCTTLLFLISTEIFVVNFLFSALAYGLAFYFLPQQRHSLLKLLLPTFIVYLATTILVSPYLYFFFGISNIGNVKVSHCYNDLLTLIIPSPYFWVSNNATMGLAFQITRNFLEQNCYLTVPFLIILAIFWKQEKNRSLAKMLMSLFIITLLLSFGPSLHIAGFKKILIFPWYPLFDLPIMNIIQVNRFGLFLSFYAAIMVAIWLKEKNNSIYLRYGLACATVICLFPSFNLTQRAVVNTVSAAPSFFTQQLYKQYLQPNENIMLLPYEFLDPPGWHFNIPPNASWQTAPNALWQAQSNFYFRMPNRLVGITPPPEFITRTTARLRWNHPEILTIAQLKSFITDKKIQAIVITDQYAQQWRPLLMQLGIKPQKIGGVELYHIPQGR